MCKPNLHFSPKNDLIQFSRLFHINHALIAAAAKREREVAFGFFIRAVHEDINLIEQCIDGALVLSLQVFERIARIRPNVHAMFMHLTRKACKRRSLTKRLTTREGHTRQQRVFEYMCKKRLRVHLSPARKIMRLWIVAAGTMMRAALREDGVAKSRPVHDGVRYRSRKFN